MWFTIFLIIALTSLLLVYRRRNSRYWRCIWEIPGPKGKPVIGNLMEILKPTEEIFLTRRQWAKEFYPIYKTQFLNIVSVSIMSPEDIEQVINVKVHEIKGFTYKVLAKWLGDGLFLSKGAKWKSRRKMLTPAFHFSILQEFVHIFNKETQNLIAELEKHCNEPYIDVVEPITEYSLCTIIETSMGVRLNEQKSADSYKETIVNYGEFIIRKIARPWLLIEPIYKLSKEFKQEKSYLETLHGFSRTVIAERKKTFDDNHNTFSTKRKAMLDLLLSAQKAGADIDDNELREQVDTFLFGGHDTVSIALSYALVALANEQQIQEELYNEIMDVLGDPDKPPTYSDLQELPLMERCIKEIMRLYPSAPMINRVTGEDIKTASGYTIPKGTNLYIYIYDLHRSPAVWENPEKFDPDRFLPENIAKRHPFAFIPFSAGSRNCIGQKYAFCELKSALCGILRKFRLEAVDTPETLRYKVDLVLRAHGEVRVKFIPRK